METSKVRLHTCQPLGTPGPRSRVARPRRQPSLRGHTLYHLPQTWERRPCSATCSPGARQETLPYTSSEAASPPEALDPSFPHAAAQAARSCPQLVGQRGRFCAAAPQRPGAGGGLASEVAAGPLQSGVRGTRSPARRPSVPCLGIPGAAVRTSLSR